MINLNDTQLSAKNISEILNRFRNLNQRIINTGSSIPKGEELKKFLAQKIDHTLLKPEANSSEIVKLCEEADNFNFASVCVMPSFVSLCRKELKSSSVKVCTVIGFPLGATTSEVKKFEAEQAIQNGAGELDMVINIGKLKSEEYNFVFNDIAAVISVSKANHILTKVIIETCLLTDEEKIKACLIAKDAGADFVKTSTGFSKSGATVEDVSLMKHAAGETMKVKASGGIRSREDALRMINAGASRIGTSSGVKIILGEKSQSNY
ncbi:MAG: deoxyribose-phosphate aldolase [Ignavibacteriaceae bacterium]|nr:deoxyribose-phosphate aldolase [Ignavibacteriaceae bacterium]